MDVLIVLLLMAAALSLVFGLNGLSHKPEAAVHVANLGNVVDTLAKPSYFERRIRPLSRTLARRLPDLKAWITPEAEVESNLAYAGEPYGLEVEQFYGMQLLAALVFGFYGALLGGIWSQAQGALLGLIFAGAFGLYFPRRWLAGRARTRQFRISIAVPDSLDLLATSMEAGLGFDDGLKHVVMRMTGPLAEEYSRFLRELQMGVPREEAFRRLIQRNSSEELRTVVGALLQAHVLGAPVSQTLQSQAEEMRVRRVQRAKEAGAQASPKITLVTTMIIAPSVMGLFLAVVGCKMAANLGPLLQEFLR